MSGRLSETMSARPEETIRSMIASVLFPPNPMTGTVIKYGTVILETGKRTEKIEKSQIMLYHRDPTTDGKMWTEIPETMNFGLTSGWARLVICCTTSRQLSFCGCRYRARAFRSASRLSDRA